MRLVWHSFCKEQGRLLGRIGEFINFPILVMQKGWTIILTITSWDPEDEEKVTSEKMIFEVKDYEPESDHDNAWIDAGDLTKDLQNGRRKITGWERASAPKPD